MSRPLTVEEVGDPLIYVVTKLRSWGNRSDLRVNPAREDERGAIEFDVVNQDDNSVLATIHFRSKNTVSEYQITWPTKVLP